jgi:hypothetical protein
MVDTSIILQGGRIGVLNAFEASSRKAHSYTQKCRIRTVESQRTTRRALYPHDEIILAECPQALRHTSL